MASMIPRVPGHREHGTHRPRAPEDVLRVIPDCRGRAGAPMLGPWTPPPTSRRPAPRRPPPSGRPRRASCAAGPTTATSAASAPGWPSTSTSIRSSCASPPSSCSSAGPAPIAYVLAWIFVPAAGARPHGAPQPPIDRSDRGTQVFGIAAARPGRERLLGRLVVARPRLVPPPRSDGPRRLAPAPTARRPPRRRASDPPPPRPTAVRRGPRAGHDHAPAASVEAPAAPRPTAPLETPTATSPRHHRRSPTRTASDADQSTRPTDPPGTAPALAPAHRLGAGPRRSPDHRAPSAGTADGAACVFPIVFGALLMWAGMAFLADVSLETGLAVGALHRRRGVRVRCLRGRQQGADPPGASWSGRRSWRSPPSSTSRCPGPVGDRTWTPQRCRGLEDHYEVSMGEGTLDLTALGAPRGDELDVEAQVGMGHLVVLVPRGPSTSPYRASAPATASSSVCSRTASASTCTDAFGDGAQGHAAPRPRGRHRPDRGAARAAEPDPRPGVPRRPSSPSSSTVAVG